LLFGFEKHIGLAAVWVSTIPFVAAHLGKPIPEVVASVFFGVLLCWVALRARSIWPGVALHWAISVFLELFSAQFFRQ
jgi:membrane protease YdiL (CAAX protease family)